MTSKQPHPSGRASAVRRLSLRLSPAVLGLLLLLPVGAARAQQLDLAALKRQSQLVFIGTVEKVGAAIEANLPVDERTAIVRVDRVLRSTDQFRFLNGREVTVQLRPEQPAAQGDTAVFFTRSWLFGKSLAVVEVGRGEAKEVAELTRKMKEVDTKEDDEKLGGRTAKAELIVLGTVIRVRPAPEERGPITEHGPDWWEATIAVDSVEKGHLPAELRVLFANSTDEMWIDSPKLRQGMRAIFLLRRDQQEKGMPALRRPGWTALDPLDVQPPGRIARLRSLIKASR
ncbi:MAG TPA: hypothetical protein VLX28_25855 [Thermoanaerobaculia bacterium]|nr:hypothetical protein [Thermoanaerobaculia bacterium]